MMVAYRGSKKCIYISSSWIRHPTILDLGCCDHQTSHMEILSGASYSTSALVLLFKSEICRVLSPSDGDSHVMDEFKSNMRTRIDYRIPIHDVHVCAVMLDPAQRHLSAVQEFLDNKGVTAVDFIEQMIQMIDKFASDDKLHEGTSVECEESTAGPSWKKAKI